MAQSERVAASAPMGVDVGALASFLGEVLGEVFPEGRLSVSLLSGGRSNLTYTVTDGVRDWVLRRPPMGHVLETAHDMSREYRVMEALGPSSVPVPGMVGFCADPERMGAPFYLMEKVSGVAYRDATDFVALAPADRNALGIAFVDVLADLALVDPGDVGLADFGRPEGFSERQVKRWSKQLAASASRNVEGAEELAQRLLRSVPTPQRASIVHGDFRLDNALVDASDASNVLAIIDWEMSTLGDPLADLGMLYLFWEGWKGLDNPIAATPVEHEGFPSWGDMANRYVTATGLSMDNFEWYAAFAFFKLAVICEGIHFRYVNELTVGDGFEQVGDLVVPLVARGLTTNRRLIRSRAGDTSMDFSFDSRTEELRAELTSFMDECVYPVEHSFHPRSPTEAFSWERPSEMAELQTEAKSRGFWNLFLPHSTNGAGLTNVQYAPLAEISGRSPHVAPEAMNCAAPDTGNMELLDMFATADQRERWLKPLLAGEIRSAYSMTEPDVASSDASNIRTSITRDGDDFLINGRKWWTTGIMSQDCKLVIVMGLSDPLADRHSRHTMLLVPREAPGLNVVRGLSAFGYWDETHGGHAEVEFDNVRVGPEALLGEQGKGFALGQARLGPGRIHHCMRLIGMADERWSMCARADTREAFGKPLAEQGAVIETIAESRVRIDQLRLLVLRAAWLIDEGGASNAFSDISAIKIAAPLTAQWVIDKAIHVHGAAGLTSDFPLAMLWAQARGLRFADGPEEVHRMVLARRELRRQREARR